MIPYLFLGGTIQGGRFPRWGFSRRELSGGSFLGGDFPETYFLIGNHAKIFTYTTIQYYTTREGGHLRFYNMVSVIAVIYQGLL